MEALRFAILGLGIGAIYALLGQSVVVVHRGSGVLNFAAGAIGMLGAFIFFKLWEQTGVPWPAALSAAFVAAALIGALVHLLVMRRLQSAAMTTRIVATLALMTTFLAAGNLLFSPEGAAVSTRPLLPIHVVTIVSGLSVGLDKLLLAAIAVAVTVAMVVVQRRTAFGLATSAVAESRLIASTLGWSPDLIAAGNWALGSVIAAGAAILAASISGLDVGSLTLLIVPTLAAALAGRFESFPLTLLGAMVVGIGTSEVGRYVTAPGWSTAAPMLLIVLVLVFRGSYLPTKSSLTQRLPSIGMGRLRWLGATAVAACLALILLVDLTWLSAITTTLLFALVVLSIVVVSGYAGQLSLVQLSLAGMSAFLTAVFTLRLGIALWGAIPLSILATVPIGALVAVPALRTRGSNLAIATLSLAVAIDAVVLTAPTYTAGLIGPPMGPLQVFGYSLSPITNPRGFALLSLVVLILATGAVANMRRGPSGRRLLAVRANERAAAAIGISVPGVKLYAFGLAAAIAAAAGAFTEAQFPVADFSSYEVLGSVNGVLEAMLGGLGWASGATLGAVGAEGAVGAKVLSGFIAPGNWLLLITGLAALLVILQSPNGLIPFNLGLLEGLWRRLRGRRGDGAGEPPVPSPPSTVPEAGRPRVGVTRAPATVEVEGVTVRFGGQVALDAVSLAIRPGRVTGLIGPNGAGKSTLVEVISGFQRATGGRVLVDGDPIDRLSPARRARLGLSRSFQSLELFEEMNVLENLRTAGDACPAHRYLTDLAWPRRSALSPAAETAIRQLRLEPFLERKPAELDYAHRRLVAVARSLAGGPTVMMLDEPAAGLDDVERGELASLIRSVSTDWGLGVLVIEHDVDLVFDVSDEIVALDSGRVIATGASEEVRHSPAVVAAYLGGEDLDGDVSPAPSGGPS